MAVIANVVIAAFTLKAARATQRSAAATEKAADATRDEADATREEAAATKQTIAEIQRDRELAHRPYLSWKPRYSRAGIAITNADAHVVNFGRGPAIHCLCCIGWLSDGDMSNLRTTRLFDLSPNDSTVPDLAMEVRSGLLLDKATAGNEPGHEPVRVAFCQDQLGNYFRFVPYQVEADIYSPSTGKELPRWMHFYKDHFARLAKD